MKKVLALIFAAVLALSLVACGDSSNQTEPNTSETTTTAVAETEPTPTESKAVEKEQEVAEPAAIPVTCGESIETDKFTMTFDSVSIMPELSFATSETSSLSAFVEEDCQILVISGQFANYSGSTISDSAFHLTAVVNSEYNYDRVDFSFVRNKHFEIDPLADAQYYMYVNIPNKLVDMFETATINIAFNDDMSTVSTIWNADGTATVEADNFYALNVTLDGSAA